MEAITTLSGALTVLAVGFVNLKWEKFGNVAVTLVALIGGGLLIWMSQTDTIWVAYAGYVLFRMSYQMMMTVSSFEIAKTLKGDSTGLIFGVNTWAALGLQTILTVTVADAAGLALTIRNQFIVYGSLYAGAGIVFAAVFAVILPLTSSAKSSNAVLSASMTESGMNPER